MENRWIRASIVALLLHLFFITFSKWMKWDLLSISQPLPIDTVSEADVRKIKSQWKRRPFVMSRDQRNIVEHTNENAVFESDKNREVEKQTRAAQSDVVMKPGSNGANSSDPLSGPSKSLPMVPLSSLGLRPSRMLNPVEQRPPTPQGGAAGADQNLLDKSIPVGAENLLNTQETKFYTFYSRIYQAIGPVWQSMVKTETAQSRPPEGEYLTRAEVVIDSSGKVVQVHITQGSGIPGFDRIVEHAWYKVPIFPNPPRGLFEADGYIHMGWTFLVAIDQRSGLLYAPPARDY